MSEIKRYGLIRCSRKTGKIDTTMEGLGRGLLQMWALQNTTKTKNTVIFEFDSGRISSLYEGDESGFPKVRPNMELEDVFIGEDLLKQFQKDAFETRKED